MDILNSKDSKTSDPHGPLLNLTFDLKRKDILLYQNLSCTIHGKIKKDQIKN